MRVERFLAVPSRDALRRAGPGTPDLKPILDGTSFATPLGTVRFDAKGDADLSLFGVLRFDGSVFVPETGG